MILEKSPDILVPISLLISSIILSSLENKKKKIMTVTSLGNVINRPMKSGGKYFSLLGITRTFLGNKLFFKNKIF